MSALRVVSIVFHSLAALGIAITAVHVVPALWESNVLDCVIVASSLAIFAVLQISRAITGKWTLE